MNPTSPEQRRARLASRHLLTPETRLNSPAPIAEAVVALHSSDPVSVYLSIAARTNDLTIGDVEQALYDSGELIRHHAMRRTLWVFSPDAARLAHHAATLPLVDVQRRRLDTMLIDNGATTDPTAWLDAAIADITRVLADHGEATTRELGEAVPELRTPLTIPAGRSDGASVAAHTRVLNLLGYMGVILRGRPMGTWLSGQYRWALADERLAGGFGMHDRATAAARLVDRYLRRFGPASSTDVQWWTGWTKRATVQALADAEAVTIDDLLVAPGDDDAVEPVGPWVALLPGLDPTTMGWKQRSWYLPDAHVAALFDRNGNAGPTIWVDGRVVGGWMQRADGSFATRLLEPLGRAHRELLDIEVERITDFVDGTPFTVRFPSPTSRALST